MQEVGEVRWEMTYFVLHASQIIKSIKKQKQVLDQNIFISFNDITFLK